METFEEKTINFLGLAEMQNFKPLKKLSEITKLKVYYKKFDKFHKVNQLVLIFCGIFALIMLLQIGTSFIVKIVGSIFPAYFSLRHLESPTPNYNEEKQWLTYWVLFSMIIMMDLIFGNLLYSIPFYDCFKLVLVVWLFHPEKQGAGVAYEKIFKPILEKYDESDGGAPENETLLEKKNE